MSRPDVHQVGVRDVEFGARVKIVEPCNLYGCKIGDDCFVGPFTEIQKGVVIGARTRVQSHAFICELVTIGEDCFVGHGVMFINDPRPRATSGGSPQTEADWQVVPTRVCRGASIGSGATILCGVTIGERAMIGAGAVVTADVAPDTTVAGVPARVLRPRREGQQA